MPSVSSESGDIADSSYPRRMGARPIATIAIPTFRRQHWLSECVTACTQQADVDPSDFEVVVVDNCPDRSGAQVVEQVAEQSPVEVRYIAERRPGISYARNAALEGARGEFVAFIDDDEVPSATWLRCLLDAQASSEADAVFGPVYMLPSDHDAAKQNPWSAFFGTVGEYRTGAEIGSSIITPFWRRGRKAYPALASSNALIRLHSVADKGIRFDARLGLTGGEDTLYFTQLAMNGARFVWCADAAVGEHIPPERQTWRYVLSRSFRAGQMVSLTPVLLKPKLRRLTLLSMIIALGQVPALAILVALHGATGSQQRYRYLVRLASATGRLFWGEPFRGRAYGGS